MKNKYIKTVYQTGNTDADFDDDLVIPQELSPHLEKFIFLKTK